MKNVLIWILLGVICGIVGKTLLDNILQNRITAGDDFKF